MGYLIKKMKDAPLSFFDGDRSSKYPKKSEFQTEGIMFLNASSTSGGTFDITEVNYISPEKYETITKGRIKPNDIILTTRGNGVGDSFLFKEKYGEALINAQMLIIRCDDANLSPQFLYYYFINPSCKDNFVNSASGSAQPQLPIKCLKEIEIKYPPLPTQRKIASILSAYDDLIENNLKRIKLLEEQAFIEYKGIVSSEQMVTESKLNEIIQTVKRKIKILKSDYKDSGEFPIIDQSTDFIGGYTNEKESVYEDIPMIVFGDHTRILKYINFHFACGADGTQLVKPKNPTISTAYLYFELISCNLSNYHYARHFKFLKEQVIKLPSEKVMMAFKDDTDVIFNLIQVLRLQNTKLREARDILLPKLMNGQIEV